MGVDQSSDSSIYYCKERLNNRYEDMTKILLPTGEMIECTCLRGKLISMTTNPSQGIMIQYALLHIKVCSNKGYWNLVQPKNGIIERASD